MAAPTMNFLMRFATRDSVLGDTLIRRGDPVMICYGAMGRDPDRYGPTADDFDITRAAGHTSFGHGPHACIGAPSPASKDGLRSKPSSAGGPTSPWLRRRRAPLGPDERPHQPPLRLRPSHQHHEAGAAT